MATNATTPDVAAPAGGQTPRQRALSMAPLLPDRCGGCGAVPDTPLTCGGCRALVYCSPGCQRAHWHEHKPRCEYVQTDVLVHVQQDPTVVATMETAWAAAYETLNAGAPPLTEPTRRDAHFHHAFRTGNAKSRRALLLTLTYNLDAGALKALLARHWRQLDSRLVFELLNAASSRCTRRWPSAQLSRAFDTWHAVIRHASVAQLESQVYDIRAKERMPGVTVAAAARGTVPAIEQVSAHDDGSGEHYLQQSMLTYVCSFFNRAIMDDAVKVLLAKRAAVTREPPEIESLQAAVGLGTAATVLRLLNAGLKPAMVYASPWCLPLLHCLAETEYPEAPEKVRLLVAAGANIGSRSRSDGLTPLALAAYTSHGSVRAFDTLLALGADVREAMTLHNGDAGPLSGSSKTARGCSLHSAAIWNNTAIVSRLLEHKHSIDIECRVFAGGLEDIIAGCTPLHLAAAAGAVGGRKGRKGALELLLEAGANIDAVDESGLTPVQHAMDENQHVATRLLLDAGALSGPGELDAVLEGVRQELVRLSDDSTDGAPQLSSGGSLSEDVDTVMRMVELLEAVRARRGGTG
jgi:hypothetical protein